MKLAILASGTPPSHEIPVRILRDSDRLIACDGAWRTAIALGRRPDAVVGDGDSLVAGDREELADLGIDLEIVSEQETNDLCKAFRYALSLLTDSCDDEIAILGSTGRREDHSLGNIFHIVDFAASGKRISIVTDHGIFEAVMPPGGRWTTGIGFPVSVFAPVPETAMSSEGLEWSLGGVSLDALWKGTLNRTNAESFSLTVDKPAILYLPHSI